MKSVNYSCSTLLALREFSAGEGTIVISVYRISLCIAVHISNITLCVAPYTHFSPDTFVSDHKNGNIAKKNGSPK